MFYVLLALRAELRERGVFDAKTQPKIDTLLPLVALGTVADVVKLDANNRRLVAQGLKRVRAGAMPPAWPRCSPWRPASPQAATASTSALPRPAPERRRPPGRHDAGHRMPADRRRRPRRRTGAHAGRHQPRAQGHRGRHARAGADDLAELFDESEEPPPAITVFDPDFHEGVVGIVASRLKDKLHRPTFVFAASGAEGKEHELKGSGRSIPGFHLRDALDLVAKRHPGVLLRFGGHAMAAGCTIDEDTSTPSSRPWRRWPTSGWTPPRCSASWKPTAAGPAVPPPDLVDTLHAEVWGQGFAPPVFCEEVQVISQRLVGEKHLSLKLKHQGEPVDGIWFGHTEPLPDG
jgi:single-stranded-DNA-specific exonuclease